MREINDRFFRDQGADPLLLGVHYDLTPRAGKTPVAFTQLGSTPRAMGGDWRPGETWVIATYEAGGFDNLVELLHETGHAVHAAAIRARFLIAGLMRGNDATRTETSARTRR